VAVTEVEDAEELLAGIAVAIGAPSADVLEAMAAVAPMVYLS
jgi:hypothetical protein